MFTPTVRSSQFFLAMLLLALTCGPTFVLAAPPSGVVSSQALTAMERARALSGGEPTVDKNIASNNPVNVQRVMRVLPESLYETLFSHRNSVYTYENFLKAVKKFPRLCGEANQTDDQCKLELSTMFAHFAQETGEGAPEPPLRYLQALYYVREAGCSDGSPGCDYRVGACENTLDTGKAYPCPTGRKYYGRGPKQLSYSYNYAPFSVAMTGRAKDFVESPEPVADNGYLAFASALWFYMTPQSPKPSIHEVALDIWVPNSNDLAVGNVAGFGSTINIINGGLECRSGSETTQASNRITYYNAFLSQFGITDTRQKSCVGMQNFPSNGAAALSSYWEEDFANPGKCKLVTYGTPFSLFNEQDYDNCVSYQFLYDMNNPTCVFAQGFAYGLEHKSGDTHADVSNLETLLQCLAFFNSSPNTIFDSTTESALKAFQRANFIPVTGKTDTATRASLNNYYKRACGTSGTFTSSSFTLNKKNPEIRRFKDLMYCLGFVNDVKKLNDTFDGNAVQVLKSFQRLWSLSPNGKVSSATLTKLNLYNGGSCKTPSSFSSTLQLTSSGQEVKNLEDLLRCLGYVPRSFIPDTTYDKATEAMVKYFQKINNLTQTGTTNTATRTVLNTYQ